MSINDIQHLDRAAAFEINVAGIKPFSPAGGLEAGFYTALVKDWGTITITRKDGGSAVKSVFVLDINGLERTHDAFLPDANATPAQAEVTTKRWRAILESAGYTDAQVGAGPVRIEASTFVGKTLCVEVRKRPYMKADGSEGFADDVFAWAPRDWEANKSSATVAKAAAEKVQPATGGSALGGKSATVTGPTPLGGNTGSLPTASLISMLNRPQA